MAKNPKIKTEKKKEKEIHVEVATFHQVLQKSLELIKDGKFSLFEFWQLLKPFARKVQSCVEGKQETLEAPHRKYAFQPKV